MIQVHFETTPADFQAFQQFITASVQREQRWSGLSWHGVAIGFAFGLLLALGASGAELPIHTPTAAGCAGAFVAVWLYARWRVTRVAVPSEHGSILGPRLTSLDESGVREEAANHDSITRWTGVLAVEETPAHVFVMVDRFAGYVVPKRAFRDPAQLDEFVAFARLRSGAPPEPTGPGTSRTGPGTS